MSQTSKGVTLIELAIALTVMLMLISLVISVFISSTRVYNLQLGGTDVTWEGQNAIETMVKEIRECYEVTSAEANAITFWWKDLNDNSTREAAETVSFSLAGPSLVRAIGSSSGNLSNNVASLNFTYDSPVDPKFVTITLTLASQGESTTFESSARLRNE